MPDESQVDSLSEEIDAQKVYILYFPYLSWQSAFLTISNARQNLYDTIVKKWHAFQANLTQQQETENTSFPPAETEEQSGPDDCPMYRHHAALYGQEFLVNGRSMEHVWVGNMGWRN